MRMVDCIKLQQNLEGLENQPFPGELGKKIFNQVSKVAWKEWLEKQKMLVNEYRLNLSEIKARQFLMTETENYFFGAPEKKSIDQGP
tara:strand:- start:363 stop:623 length:261 start_codon:yes stop_codon:yes gene_type:complete